MFKMYSNKNVNVKLWKNIAIVSGIVSVLLCFLIIVNYIQINRWDPVNTEAVNTMVERLRQNPADETLRNEVRALDLMVRKAYFTNQWQVRIGGYITLISLAIMLISIQIINASKKLAPNTENTSDDNEFLLNGISRKWISIGGSALVVIALFLSFMTHERLGDTFRYAAKEASGEVTMPVKEQIVKQAKGSIQQEAKVLEKEKETITTDNTAKSTSKQDQAEPAVKKEETKTIEEKPKAVNQSISEFVKKERENFPYFRGSGGLGIAYQTNIPTDWDGASNKNIKWKVKLGLQGYNSPIIWDEKLFLSSAKDKFKEVYCYDKNTGTLLWKSDVSKINGTPEKVPATTEDTGLAAPTMATDGKYAFAIFANGDIVALDFNGKLVWSKNLGVPQNHYGHSSSLIIHNDKLLIQYDHGKSAKVLALSTKDGSQLWSTPRKVKISWASPVIAYRGAQAELLLIAEPTIAAYDPDTGKELWSIECIFGEVGPSVTYLDGVVYGLNEYASLVAISGGNTPKLLWEDFDYLSDVPSPIATNEMLFVVTSYGMVICHDAKTGKKHWEQEFSNGFYSSPILVGNKIYLIDREGITHILKADKTFEIIAQPKLGEEVVSTPAFADGQIFIRAVEHLYCIQNGK